MDSGLIYWQATKRLVSPLSRRRFRFRGGCEHGAAALEDRVAQSTETRLLRTQGHAQNKTVDASESFV
jgi:hypothetical protein